MNTIITNSREELRTRLNEFLTLNVTEELINLLLDLKIRWGYEKEYEDFSEYQKLVKGKFPQVKKVLRRPFGISFRSHFIHDGCPFELRAVFEPIGNGKYNFSPRVKILK